MDIQISKATHDETKIELTVDQIDFAKRTSAEVCNSLGFVLDCIQGQSFKVSSRANGLGAAFASLKRLADNLGYEADLEEEHKADVKNIRALNGEVRRLNDLLAKATPVDGLGALLYELGHSIYKYWNELGLGSMQGSFFADYSSFYYYQGKFTCFLVESMLGSDTQISDEKRFKKRIAKMKKEGLKVVGETHDYRVLDCPESRKWFLDKMTKRFPSFEVFSWESRRYNLNKEAFYISSFEGRIQIGDLKNGQGNLPSTKVAASPKNGR